MSHMQIIPSEITSGAHHHTVSMKKNRHLSSKNIAHPPLSRFATAPLPQGSCRLPEWYILYCTPASVELPEGVRGKKLCICM